MEMMMGIQQFKTCHCCGKQQPRGWTEADIHTCDECRADMRAAWRETIKSCAGDANRQYESDSNKRGGYNG